MDQIEKNIKDYEINIFNIILIILRDKWKVILITLFFTAAGILYNINDPKIYYGSKSFTKPQNSVFINYISLNEVLANKNLNYQINSQTVFDIFLSEFNDYEEIINVLENDIYVKSILNGMDQKQKSDMISQLSKSFVIRPTPKTDAKYEVEFKWHNLDQGISILTKAISSILKNTKIKIEKDIKHINSSLINKKKSELKKLNLLLKNVEDSKLLESKTSIARKIFFLKNS